MDGRTNGRTDRQMSLNYQYVHTTMFFNFWKTSFHVRKQEVETWPLDSRSVRVSVSNTLLYHPQWFKPAGQAAQRTGAKAMWETSAFTQLHLEV